MRPGLHVLRCMAVRDRGRLRAPLHAELGEDPRHVDAGGLLGHEQRRADLAVGRPLGDSASTWRSRGVRPKGLRRPAPSPRSTAPAIGRDSRSSRAALGERPAPRAASHSEPSASAVAAPPGPARRRRAVAGVDVRLGLAPAEMASEVRAIHLPPRRVTALAHTRGRPDRGRGPARPCPPPGPGALDGAALLRPRRAAAGRAAGHAGQRVALLALLAQVAGPLRPVGLDPRAPSGGTRAIRSTSSVQSSIRPSACCTAARAAS